MTCFGIRNNKENCPLTDVAELLGHPPTKKKVTSRFSVRARAWVAGSVPSQGTYERQLIDVSLLHP